MKRDKTKIINDKLYHLQRFVIGRDDIKINPKTFNAAKVSARRMIENHESPIFGMLEAEVGVDLGGVIYIVGYMPDDT